MEGCHVWIQKVATYGFKRWPRWIEFKRLPKQIQKTTEFAACLLYFEIASVDKSVQLATFFVLTFCHFLRKNVNCINIRFTYLVLCVRGCYSETGFHIGMDRNFVCFWRRHNCNWSLPFCADLLIYEINYWVFKQF